MKKEKETEDKKITQEVVKNRDCLEIFLAKKCFALSALKLMGENFIQQRIKTAAQKMNNLEKDLKIGTFKTDPPRVVTTFQRIILHNISLESKSKDKEKMPIEKIEGEVIFDVKRALRLGIFKQNNCTAIFEEIEGQRGKGKIKFFGDNLKDIFELYKYIKSSGTCPDKEFGIITPKFCPPELMSYLLNQLPRP